MDFYMEPYYDQAGNLYYTDEKGEIVKKTPFQQQQAAIAQQREAETSDILKNVGTALLFGAVTGGLGTGLKSLYKSSTKAVKATKKPLSSKSPLGSSKSLSSSKTLNSSSGSLSSKSSSTGSGFVAPGMRGIGGYKGPGKSASIDPTLSERLQGAYTATKNAFSGVSKKISSGIQSAKATKQVLKKKAAAKKFAKKPSVPDLTMQSMSSLAPKSKSGSVYFDAASDSMGSLANLRPTKPLQSMGSIDRIQGSKTTKMARQLGVNPKTALQTQKKIRDLKMKADRAVQQAANKAQKFLNKKRK